jgi:hypothetical protein
MLKKILLTLTAIAMVGCFGGPDNDTLDDNSDKEIRAMITKGVTTKQEIQDKFGKSELVKTDDLGREVWYYEDERTSFNPLNIIPVTKVLVGQTGREKKLVITFVGDVVYNYVLTNVGVRTRGGLFTSKTEDKNEEEAKAQKKAAEAQQ